MAATTPSTPENNRLTRFLAQRFVINWEVALYIVILVLAIFTRFYLLGDRAMSHDESLHTRYSWNLYADGNFQHTPLMHGPILFHATAFFYFLFGDNDFSARIYTALLGVLVVMSPVLFRRWIGRTGALVASVMLLISPIMLYYNRYIRHDTPSILYAIIMMWAIFMYLDGPPQQKRKARWLYVIATMMILNLGSKETSFIYIAIFGSILTLYWLVRLAQHFWRLPGRTIYYFITIGILVAGVVALALYVVWSIVPLDRAVTNAAEFGWLGNVESSAFITWTLIAILAGLVLLVGTMLWAFRGSRVAVRWSDIVILLLIAAVTATGLMIIEEASHLPPRDAGQHAAPANPETDPVALNTGINTTPVILWWIVCAVAVAGILASWRLGWWRTLHRFAEFDILIIMGTLILPWLTPFITKAMGVAATDYSQEGIIRALMSLVPAFAVSITLGLVWNWKRWLIAAVIFHAIFAFFFTTMFTNMNGLATGMIGSLGYWLEQQGVRRGSQPQYYYLMLIMPFYEFLPVIGSTLAMFSGLGIFWKYRRERLEAQTDINAPADDALMDVGEDAAVPPPAPLPVKRYGPEWLRQPSFLIFVSWLGILNLVGYTLAGEKMPWLGTHLTLPLIFLSGWYFGRLIERIDPQRFRQGGWLYLILLPLVFVTGFQIVAPFLLGTGPFAGLTQAQLVETGQWLAVVAVTGLVLLVIYQFVDRTGWRHLRQMFAVAIFLTLGLLTTRSALMASFINYDYATEYLVYAHGAPAIKQVLDQIHEISLRTTDGNDLSFSYDNEVSWPYTWYFRDYPNATFFGSSPSRPIIDNSVVVLAGEANRSAVEPLLEDRYYHFDYIRLWWPMQDYFNLTAARMTNLLDFSPDNPTAAQLRQGLFDIWWARDYSTYGSAVGRNFNVTSWPVSDRMHLWVRKDVAAQVWNLGVGEGTVLNPLTELEENVCNTNWQLLVADQIYGMQGTLPGQLSRPVGASIGADGNLYVADEVTNRITVYNPQGELVTTYGQDASGAGELFFTRPNSVAVGPDENIYIADTWNYRVVVLAPDGALINAWGEPGEFGLGAQTEPVNAFWGPRDVAVDRDGNVYVADTGNKRIRVYTADGTYLRDIGSGGNQTGQLDEPAGLALHPDGRLFVADTWNRRVTVYTTDGGYLYDFPVRGWYEELGNRPYLAVDSERGIVYVGDPDAGRVLVYDVDGNCLGSFGQPTRENPNASQFRTVSGLAVDAAGNVYVADAGFGRVLRFAPFMESVTVPDAAGDGEVIVEVTAELELDMAAEATAEMTPEVPDPETTPEVDAAG